MKDCGTFHRSPPKCSCSVHSPSQQNISSSSTAAQLPSWGLGCRQRCGCIQQSGTWISAFMASSASSPVLHLEPPCIVSSQKPSTSSTADSLVLLLAPKVLGVKVHCQGKSSCLKPDIALGRRKIYAKLNESQGPTDLLLQRASFQTCPWGLMSISIQSFREG